MELDECRGPIVQTGVATLAQAPHGTYPERVSETIESVRDVQIDNTLQVNRHDDHNLELRAYLSLSDRTRHGRIDFYLFTPNAAYLQGFPKTEIISDFRARARLFLPLLTIADDRELIWNLSQLDLQSQLRLHRDSETLSRDLEATLMTVGTLMSEKYNQTSLTLAPAQTNTPTGLLSSAKIMKSVSVVTEYSNKVRSYLSRLTPLNIEEAQLLDEFLSFLHTELLIKVSALEAQFPELEAHLTPLLKVQGERNNRIHEFTDENYSLRTNYLKKYFQSHLAANLTQQESLKRVSEPIAALAAGLAALIVSLVERQTQSDLLNVSLKGLALILIGTVFYVLKDRFKDWWRDYITSKIKKIIPDFDRDIFIKNKLIGHSKEWFLVKRQADLPSQVLQMRKSLAHNLAEKKLQEDVLHYRQDFEVSRKLLADRYGHWGFMQNIRINLMRYFKYLDDPTKTYKTLTVDGQIHETTAHRFYQFYVCLTMSGFEQIRWWKRVWHTDKLKLVGQEQMWYEVIVDKSGIKKVELLKQFNPSLNSVQS